VSVQKTFLFQLLFATAIHFIIFNFSIKERK